MDFHWNEIKARAWIVNRCCAVLFGPLTMPPALLKALQKLDTAYQPSGGKKSCVSDAERVAFLFELYQRITSLVSASAAKKFRNTKAIKS